LPAIPILFERAGPVSFTWPLKNAVAGNAAPGTGSYVFSRHAMRNRTLWIVIGFIIIVLMLIGGLLPLPGQKDNVTPLTEPAPSGQSRR
jgi:hypothetical protein